MFNFSKIALRSIFRNKRRSLITGSILIFGCVALIVTRGFIEKIYGYARESAILQGIGHLQVYNPAFLDKDEAKPLEYGLDQHAAIQQLLNKVPHVRATEARLQVIGLISNGDKSMAFMGEAGQPEAQKQMGMLVEAQTGTDLLASTAENSVLLGGELAKSLNAKPGDVLTILTTTVDGALNGIDVIVAGTFSTGIKEADLRLLYMRLNTAQRLLATDRVTKLVIGLDLTENTELAKKEIERTLQKNHFSLALRPWSELSTSYRQTKVMLSVIFFVLGLIIAVLVVLSSSNTMMMAIFERVQEIGTLMALGTSRRGILGLFLLEGLFMGILGGAASVGIAWSFIALVNSARIRIPPMPGTTASGFPIQFSQMPEAFAGVFILAVGMMILGAAMPALRGSRMKIVDALGHI